MRVNRNYFGRQTESFEAELDLPFLAQSSSQMESASFHGIFIRAPVVEQILPSIKGEQAEERARENTVIAPARDPKKAPATAVEIMATLPGRNRAFKQKLAVEDLGEDIGNIVAVRQQNVFGTSFHPELTQDVRIHTWWLEQVRQALLEPTDRTTS